MSLPEPAALVNSGEHRPDYDGRGGGNRNGFRGFCYNFRLPNVRC